MNDKSGENSAVLKLGARMAQRLTDDWRMPVLIVVQNNERDAWTMAPSATVQKGYQSICKQLGHCAATAAQEAWSSTAAAGGAENPITLQCMEGLERTAWVRRFRLESSLKCALFGCVASARSRTTPGDSRPLGTEGVVGALDRWAETLPDILNSAQASAALIAGANQQRKQECAEQKARAVLSMDPESEDRMLDALSCYDEIEAVAHLRVTCNGQGVASLQHEWIARRNNGALAKVRVKGMSSYCWAIQGTVADAWDRRLPTHPAPLCFSLPLRSPEPNEKRALQQDPLESYRSGLPRALRNQLSRCKTMVMSFVGAKVPHGACDIDPHCEYKMACKVHAAECHRIGEGNCDGCDFTTGCRLKLNGRPPKEPARLGPWNWRLVAVNLVFTRGAFIRCRAAFSVIETTSLLNHLRAEQEVLDELVLRGLPLLDQRSKRAYLRHFFEYCRATEEPHVKGPAFERLASGLVALVPGWVPGNRNLHTPENEVDLPVLVEPTSPAARYWFDQFGGKLIVECKNHEHLHERSTTIKGKRTSPVKKLHDILRKNDVKLGLILNTGTVSERLHREAQRRARPYRLVVLFDGADMKQVIDYPADAEMFFKKRVAEAAMRLSP
jgi:hypothetical protein